GERSIHFRAIQGIMAQGKGVTLLHEPSASETFKPHVMAVVPLGSSGFYMVLEQQADVALAIPIRLQQELIALTSLGFLVTLLVAWVTTRQVVKPTEQLTAAARRMAQGDLESPIEINALDEVGQLAEDIETMRRQLKRARDDLEQAKLGLEHKVAERTRRLHETLGKVIAAQEEERLRLARELHDETSQALGALCVSLDRLGKVSGQSSPQGLAEIEQARAMARSLLQETRRLIYDLRPSVLDDMGLEAAIRWSAETHVQRSGVEVTICNSLGAERLPLPMEVALFRVAQEALVNIERHAQARHASIVLERRGSSVGMQVWDDGRGFDSGLIGNGTEASGAGLEGMQERAHLLGGSMEIVSALGKGTIIKVEVPLE
ncbi:MAG: histidine kinase, partial [Dehalococcoidia bacterium]|nr:histidine kinase [Dehalococcoidia bacterium]